MILRGGECPLYYREKQKWSGISAGRLWSYNVSHSHGLKLTSRGVKVAARITVPLTFGDCNSILWFSVHCPIVCSSGAQADGGRELSLSWVCSALESPPPHIKLIDCPAQPNYHHQQRAWGYLFRQNFFKDGQNINFQDSVAQAWEIPDLIWAVEKINWSFDINLNHFSILDDLQFRPAARVKEKFRIHFSSVHPSHWCPVLT